MLSSFPWLYTSPYQMSVTRICSRCGAKVEYITMSQGHLDNVADFVCTNCLTDHRKEQGDGEYES